MEEVTGGWKEFHNVVFHDLYCSPNITMDDDDELKEDVMGRACGTCWGEMKCKGAFHE
jgi:hypothetical protein